MKTRLFEVQKKFIATLKLQIADSGSQTKLLII